MKISLIRQFPYHPRTAGIRDRKTTVFIDATIQVNSNNGRENLQILKFLGARPESADQWPLFDQRSRVEKQSIQLLLYTNHL